MDCPLHCVTGTKFVQCAGSALKAVAPRLFDLTEQKNEKNFFKDKGTT